MSIRQLASKRRVENSPQIDTFYDQVSVLTNFDNGIRDAKLIPWFNVGSARTTLENSRFGSGSLLLDNSANSWLSSPSNSAFSLQGNFTLEMWIRPGALTGNFQFLLATGADASPGTGGIGLLLGNNTYQLSFIDYTLTTPAAVVSSSSNVVANQWQHIAVTRNGSTVRMYINGAVVGTATNSRNWSGVNIGLGAAPAGIQGVGSRRFNGMIDGLRITQGVARYTGAFIPPTAPVAEVFPQSDTTIDPFYDNVLVLNLFDGTNNTSSFPNMKYSIHDRYWTSEGVINSNSILSPANQPAALFSGTSRLLTQRSENLGLISADFTIEMWVRPSDAAGNECLFDCRHDTQTGFAIYSSITDFGNCWGYRTNTDIIGHGNQLSTAAWTHIAIVRDNGTIRGYENGILVFSAIDNRSLSSAPRYVLGQASNLSDWYSGRISMLRITKGVARYGGQNIGQTVFTPTTSLPSKGNLSDNAQLFATCDLDFGLTSNIISDKSAARMAWTPQGNAFVINGELFTDGDGDRLTAVGVENSLYDFTGDFTLETVVKPAGIKAGGGTIFVNSQDVPGSAGISLYQSINAYDVSLFNYPTTANIIVSTAAMNPSHDNHVAISRRGTTVRMFINGIDSGTATSSTSWTANNQVGFLGNVGAANSFNGSAKSLKITRGFSRYTSNFVPPIPRIDTHIDSVTSLIHGQGANLSTRINDRNGRLWTAVGNASLRSANALFGISSLYFDGTGDAITTPTNPDAFSFPGDFTVEFWIRPDTASSASTKTLWDNSVNANGQLGLGIGLQTNHRPYLYNYNTSTFVIQSPTAFVQNKWTHFAVSRSGATTRMFMDGVAVGSTTALRQDIVNGSTVNVGGHSTAGTQFTFSGNMAEIRVTKGVGRYIDNFPVPTGMFPDI